MKKSIVLLLSLILILSVTACSKNGDSETSDTSYAEAEEILGVESLFTTRDKEIGYDTSSSEEIVLSDKDVTISEEGVYVLSGSLSDGQVIIDADDSAKIQIVLNGVNISSSNSAAIYVKNANKVFITLAQDSENTLSVTGEYEADGDNNVDGAIFSKSDITLNGNGSLTINAKYGHGIVGKDDIAITSGTYNITAASHGITDNNSVRIADGTLNIVSGKDGIQAQNDEDAATGFFYMATGSLTIDAEGDGISSSGIALIDNGTYSFTTGDGAESVTLQSDGSGGGMMQQQTTTDDTSAVNQKGIKSDSNIIIKNGTFTIDTVDDAIHAGADVQIADGEFTIKTGDDGIHADNAVTIDGGTFSLPYCYEGVEGLTITINGGTFDIVSSDDGFNAAGGADSSGVAGGDDPFATTDGADITINDGNITIVSDGDSMDSNNTLTINGGTLNLTCNGNGNTAIDTNGSYTNNGGDVTTNDGSESGTQMGGQMGGQMGR